MDYPRLAKVINVTRLPDGYFAFSIDGHVFPWTIQHLTTGVDPGLEVPSITVTIPADRVEVINQAYDD